AVRHRREEGRLEAADENAEIREPERDSSERECDRVACHQHGNDCDEHDDRKPLHAQGSAVSAIGGSALPSSTRTCVINCATPCSTSRNEVSGIVLFSSGTNGNGRPPASCDPSRLCHETST